MAFIARWPRAVTSGLAIPGQGENAINPTGPDILGQEGQGRQADLGVTRNDAYLGGPILGAMNRV